ncbi:MAG TPA: IS200/IS605 family transposase [Thermomicrobiales bacterium]|jgi:putative transposase|nr:IS200/IS605 family transposase [Thermomicrobiales bacterium]
MPYSRLFYHVVWSTKGRHPWLTTERATLVERMIRHKLHEDELKTILHAIAVMPDHVHVAMSVLPDQRLAWVIQQMKGSSSFLLQREDPSADDEGFAWQGEYAVLSFSERNLPTVVDYIVNQEARHAENRLNAGLEPFRDGFKDPGVSRPMRSASPLPVDLSRLPRR